MCLYCVFFWCLLVLALLWFLLGVAIILFVLVEHSSCFHGETLQFEKFVFCGWYTELWVRAFFREQIANVKEKRNAECCSSALFLYLSFPFLLIMSLSSWQCPFSYVGSPRLCLSAVIVCLLVTYSILCVCCFFRCLRFLFVFWSRGRRSPRLSRRSVSEAFSSRLSSFLFLSFSPSVCACVCLYVFF